MFKASSQNCTNVPIYLFKPFKENVVALFYWRKLSNPSPPVLLRSYRLSTRQRTEQTGTEIETEKGIVMKSEHCTIRTCFRSSRIAVSDPFQLGLYHRPGIKCMLNGSLVNSWKHTVLTTYDALSLMAVVSSLLLRQPYVPRCVFHDGK